MSFPLKDCLSHGREDMKTCFVLGVLCSLFLPVLLLAQGAANGGADYHSWTFYKSDRYPLVIYSQETKGQPQETLFRAEAAMGAFERDYPGFHFKLAKPIEVPLAWDAPHHFRPINKNDFSILPLALSDKRPNWDDAISSILEAELKETTQRELPDWFTDFILDEWEGDNYHLETGSGPIFTINPGCFSKMVQNGHFQALDSFDRPIHEDPLVYGDSDPSFARWMSAAMDLLYAQQVPAGKHLQTSLTQILVAAQAEGQQAQADLLLKDLVKRSSAITKEVEAYWAAISPEAFVLAEHLEASARLWASLAVFADEAGTRYANFADLAAAVKSGQIPLPPEVPRSLVPRANMFLDRDGSYELTWNGPTAEIREIAREGFGFDVHATATKSAVDAKVVRFTADAKDMAKLPDPNANPFYSEHYLILTDGTPEHTSDILLEGDLFYKRLTAELPWPQPHRNARFVMYYYSDAWAAGLSTINYYQRDTGVITVSPLGDDTMRHEMVHQIVDFSTRGNFAWWFNEAIAEYYGRHITYAGNEFVGPVRLADETEDIQHYLAGRWPGKWGKLTLAQVVHLDPAAWSALKHGPYTFSWSIVYYIIHGDDGAHRALFDDYMRATAANQGDAKARDAAFDAAAMQLEPGWRKYWSDASSHADDSRNREVTVRLTYLLMEEAGRQGFANAAQSPSSLNDLLARHGLKPAVLHADRITAGGMNYISQRWSWQNKWTVEGAGKDLRLTCTYPSGTKVVVWRDPATGAIASQATLCAADLAKASQSTLPQGPPPKMADGGDNGSSSAQRPMAPSFPTSGSLGGSYPPSFPTSGPSPAVNVKPMPPSFPVNSGKPAPPSPSVGGPPAPPSRSVGGPPAPLSSAPFQAPTSGT